LIVGAFVLSVVFGESYYGSSFLNDISVNTGILVNFAVSSGFLFIYVAKSYAIPPSNLRIIGISALISMAHSGIYTLMFLKLAAYEVLIVMLSVSLCVVVIEYIIYLVAFRPAAIRDTIPN
jgi:hypothetical protein